MAPGRSSDAQTSTPASTDNGSHSIWGTISHAATSAREGIEKGAHIAATKVHEVQNDPNVQAKVKAGAHVATNIGTDVVTGVKNDGLGMAADVKSGNYGHAALRAAPLLVGGPAGIIVKEVAPKVIASGVHNLPPGARATVETSGVGRVLVGAAEHGHIPTSPMGVVGMVADNAKRTALTSAVNSATGGRDTHAGGYGAGTNTPEGGSALNRFVLGAVTHGGHIPTSSSEIVRAVGSSAQRTAQQEVVHEVRERATHPAAPASAAQPIRTDAAPAAAPIVVSKGSQVFPSWMKPHQ